MMEKTDEQGGELADIILDAESIKELWSKTYNTRENPIGHTSFPTTTIHIYFRDSIQEIHGIEKFKEMTERLTERSKDLTMNIVRAIKCGTMIFLLNGR